MTGAVDWRAVFEPTLGLTEIVLRGSLMYLALFCVLRFIARRHSGNFGPADLLVIVLIADASQNAFGRNYSSVTEGVVLVLTIIAWENLLDWLAWRYPRLRPLLIAPPLKLIEHGKLIKPNMDRQLLSEDELKGQLRERGVSEVGDVDLATLEGDGRLSVLKRSGC